MGKDFSLEFLNSNITDAGMIKLPDELDSRFAIKERLGNTDLSETFLLEEKNTGKLFVLKSYAVETGFNEANLMQGLEHKSLSVFEADIKINEITYTLREYAEGIPLDAYYSINRLGVKQAIGIAKIICDVLGYLHAQPEPIIHRDIKPSNIIINPETNDIKLIDFGIARKYDEHAENDTAYLGTREYAAPEQYGYAQTDARSDIYSLGVLLRFMLAGSPKGSPDDKELSKIISKAASFAPENRYQSAAALKRALSGYLRRVKQKIISAVIAAAALSIAFAAGFFTGGYVKAVDMAAYRFTEPLIEEAVRAQLGISGGRMITKADLLNIEVLAVAGPDALSVNGDIYSPEYDGVIMKYMSPDYAERGSIRLLDDIAMMRNIKRLALVGQQITDLTPLKGLPLAYINLSSNPISDISALRYCSDLEDISISNTDVSDISALSYLHGVFALKINHTKVAALTPLGWTNTSIRYLYADQIPARDFGVLKSLPKLERLTVTLINQDEMEAVCAARTVTHLYLVNAELVNFEPLRNMDRLEELYLYSFFNALPDLSVLHEMERFKKLSVFTDIYDTIRDAHPSASFEILELKY